MIAIVAWASVLVVSLYILVRGAGYFIDGSKALGASFGMSTFAIGVVIVGFGASVTELATAIAAVVQGATEIVPANAVGSAIVNILLVVGLLAAIGGKIIVKRDLIKTELPIFFIATAHFLISIYDGTIDRLEGVLLLGTFAAYVWYLFYEAEDVDKIKMSHDGHTPRFTARSLLALVGGLAAVVVGAHFTVEGVTALALALSVPSDIVAITVIAIGTSLPELFLALHASKNGEPELAVANIFGSNIFNMLAATGVAAVSMPLLVGEAVLFIGVPVMLAASAIFFVTGLKRQIMRWEGMMMLVFFGFFIAKLVMFI